MGDTVPQVSSSYGYFNGEKETLNISKPSKFLAPLIHFDPKPPPARLNPGSTLVPPG